MRAETAAAYCDEVSVERFLARVGDIYPRPARVGGRGDVWPKAALDRAIDGIESQIGAVVHDIADQL